MLMLTRRLNQEIVIGDNLATITIKHINWGQVKLGITANKEISVHRREVYDRIKRDE